MAPSKINIVEVADRKIKVFQPFVVGDVNDSGESRQFWRGIRLARTIAKMNQNLSGPARQDRD